MSEGQHKPERRHAEAPVVGLTGARFGGAVGRRLRQTSPPSAVETTPNGSDSGDGPPVGQIGARFAPSRRGTPARSGVAQNPGERPLLHAVPALPEFEPGVPEPDTAMEPAGMPPGSAEWIIEDTDWEGSELTYGRVRPYAWTKGRTTARQELALEALVSATGAHLDPAAGPEHHAIVRLCSTPRSVAEVAATLSVPLGVARVLLGDMADSGSVVVHRAAGTTDGAPDLALMQRVLTCLQRL